MVTRMKDIPLLFLLVAGLISLSNCGNDDSGPDFNEMPGNFLTSDQKITSANNIQWSRDGREIYCAGFQGLFAVNISSQEVRTIDDSSPKFWFVQSSSGEQIYFFDSNVSGGGFQTLYRVDKDGSDKTEILDSLQVIFSNPPFIVTSDNQKIVYSAGNNQAFVFDMVLDTTYFLGPGVPLSISPDDEEVLMFDGESLPNLFYKIDIQSANNENLDGGTSGPLSWNSQGLFSIREEKSFGNVKLIRENILTGQNDQVWEKDFETSDDVPFDFFYSPDLSRAAYYRVICIEGGEVINCDSIIAIEMWIINLNTGEEYMASARKLLVSFGGGGAEFTDDGQKVAYFIEKELYWIQVE